MKVSLAEKGYGKSWETGVKEIDQGIIIVIMARHNQDFK